MDIKEIAFAESISGILLFEDKGGERYNVVQDLTITKENFKVLFFNELPLPLSSTPTPNLLIAHCSLPSVET